MPGRQKKLLACYCYSRALSRGKGLPQDGTMPKQARVLVVGGASPRRTSPKHFVKGRRSCPRRTSTVYHTERLPSRYRALRQI